MIKYMTSPIKLVIYGHTHKFYSKEINGIRFVSNPRGYPYERTGYVDGMTFNL